MANAVTIHVIRHEKTNANLEKRYIGRTDESIVQAVARQMPIEAKVVYTSEKKRTIETAQLYFPKATTQAYPGFNEIDFGDFEMKTYEQLKNLPHYRAWIDDPVNYTPPNGESFVQFQQRVFQTFHELVQSSGEYTFVVHGGVIRLLLTAFTNSTFQHIHAAHHTLYTFQWDDVQMLKEGLPCTSYSEDYLTEKHSMS